MRRTSSACSPPGAAPARRRLVAAVSSTTSVVLLGWLSACTSAEERPDTPTPQAGTGTPAVEVAAPVTRVVGRLSDQDRLAVRRQVESLLADYVTGAFLDPETRGDERFPGFTDGAARLAREQGAVLTRTALDTDGTATVEAVRALAPVNVVAAGGRAVGATARLDLRLAVTPPPASETPGTPDADPVERVRIRGRVLLTPVGQGWQVFGFDVTRTGG